MKRRLLVAGLGAGITIVMLVAGAVLAFGSAESRLGLAQDSAIPIRTQFDFSALHQGVLAWSGEYETHGPVLDAWHAHPRLAVMDLEEGVRSTDPCLRLSQVEQYDLVGRQTSVRLCTIGSGTAIYVRQRLYLR